MVLFDADEDERAYPSLWPLNYGQVYAMQDQITLTSSDHRYYALNAWLLAAHLALVLMMLFGLPVLARLSGAGWVYGAVAISLLSNGYWALLHEALHGRLLRDKRRNRSAGRLLAILFGSSYRLLRFGHLGHHAFNRHPLDRPDTFDPSKTSRTRAYLQFFLTSAGGHYFAELLLPILFWAPSNVRSRILNRIFCGKDSRLANLRRQARATLESSAAVSEIRADSAMAIGALVAAALIWGENWPILAVAMAIRAFLISWTDNLYHFRTPIDRPEFAMTLRAPKALQLLILNANLHQVHHRSMQLPWWRLPQAFRIGGGGFDGSFFGKALEQIKGPAPLLVS